MVRGEHALAVGGARPAAGPRPGLAVRAADLLPPPVPAAARAAQAVSRRHPLVRRPGPAGRRLVGRQVPRRVARGSSPTCSSWGRAGGLSAAIAAAEAGARVVVVEAEAAPEAGGGAGDDADDLAARQGARRGGPPRHGRNGLVRRDGHGLDGETIWEIRARAVVAATGTYELVPLGPGVRPAGGHRSADGRPPARGTSRASGRTRGAGRRRRRTRRRRCGAARSRRGRRGADPDECSPGGRRRAGVAWVRSMATAALPDASRSTSSSSATGRRTSTSCSRPAAGWAGSTSDWPPMRTGRSDERARPVRGRR